MRKAIPLIVAAVLLSNAAWGTSVPVAPSGERCSLSEPDPNILVRACSEAIDSQRLKGRDLARAHVFRAMAQRARQRFDSAIGDFTAAIAIEPHPAVFLERGKTYVAAFRHQEAITDFDAAASRNPKAVDVFEEVAETLAGDHYFAEATIYFDAGIRRLPKDSHLVRRRGDMEDYLGNQDAALGYYDAALRLDPKNAAAHSSRAVVFMHRRDYDQALAELDKALRLQPQFAHAHYVRGRALFDLGRYEDAAQAFAATRAAGRRDVYAVTWRYLAQTRAGRDGRAELREHAQELDLSLWPGAIAKLMLGDMSPDDIIGSAQHHDARTMRLQRCEALFFIGEHHLLEGRKQEAAAAFDAAVATGVIAFVEYWHAKRELERLRP